MECISATGIHLLPLVIYKGTNVQQQWFPKEMGAYKGWYFTAIKKGWTNDDIGLEWLTKRFLLSTRPTDPGQRRLLVLDGYHSHTTVEFIWQCFANKVQVLYLLAHYSHVLQPLDLSIFGPLKVRYRALLKERQSQSLEESSVVGKRLFLEYYQLVRQYALSERNIRSGWRARGLWPVNISKPLISRHLVENNSQYSDPNASNASNTPIEPITTRGARLEDYGYTSTPISTPKKARELRAILRPDGTAISTERILFRKVEKAFDTKDFRLALQQRKIEELEATVERLRPTKRRKVVPDPNTTFTTIDDVHRAQVEAGRIEVESEEEDTTSELEEEESEAEDCIVAR